MSEDIRPADVYAQVLNLITYTKWLCYLVTAAFLMSLFNVIQRAISDCKNGKLCAEVRELTGVVSGFTKVTKNATNKLVDAAEKVGETVASGSGIISGGKPKESDPNPESRST